METEYSEKLSSEWMLSDIFKLIWSTVKNNPAAMISVFILYGAIFACLKLLWAADSAGAAFLRAFFYGMAVLSLISVLRSVFESGKVKLKAVFPGLGFIGKIILAVILLTLVSVLLGLFFNLIAVFASYFFMSVFGRLFTPDTIPVFAAAGVFINLLLTVYFSFCLISFSGKNGFFESLDSSYKILAENKILFFCFFAVLSAGIVYWISSYLSLNKIPRADTVAKVVSLRATGLKFTFVSSFFIPLYWFFLTAVYFSLGHEGETKKIMEERPHYGGGYPDDTDAVAEQEAANADDEAYESFSLSNAVYFSWGIYKKLFIKLTSGITAAYAVFICLFAGVVFVLQHAAVIPPVFSAKSVSIKDIFFLSAGGFVFYYFLMFFYSSYAHGFFRGKGMRAKNFFPPFKVVMRFVFFLCFIAAFLISVPFIVEKINLLLQIAVKSYEFPLSAVVAACSVLFAVIIAYALVSLFYVPFFILDGHVFSDALATCSEMMGGQRMVFFCVLCGLFFFNFIGHAFIIGWVFTVPFSVLVLLQIYITISAGFSKYKEDVVNYV